jgi:hypothetical protein
MNVDDNFFRQYLIDDIFSCHFQQSQRLAYCSIPHHEQISLIRIQPNTNIFYFQINLGKFHSHIPIQCLDKLTKLLQCDINRNVYRK